MNITPTDEQNDIIAAALNTTDNLLIEARAGAAKTTTLCMIAEALPPTRSLCLAFNRAVKQEMEKRLPRHVECLTLNALGHRIWRDFTRKKIDLEAGKTPIMLAKLIKANLDPKEADEFYDDHYQDMREMCATAKRCGYVPEGMGSIWKSLSTIDEVLEVLSFKPTDQMLTFLDKVIKASLRDALKGIIDFDDQIMLPCVAPVSWPVYKTVYIDETQDLSDINHFMLKKLVRKNRLIAVGDPFQAIYAFRGANTESMDDLAKIFPMTKHYLTINFRSGSAILDAVKWRAPDIKARPNAPEGVVRSETEWDETLIQDGDAIICRNNAPIFRMAIYLIAAGRYPELIGRDVTTVLSKILSKLGKGTVEQAQALVNLDKWKKKELAKSKRKGFIKDQYACLQLFIERNVTLQGAREELTSLASTKGRIKLMTGHKAKGAEFSTVFFLDEFLISDEEQDLNLRYVIATRAKDALIYIKTDGRRELEL